MQLTLEFETVADLKQRVALLAQDLGVGTALNPKVLAAEEAPAPTPDAAPRRKPGRPSAAEIAAEHAAAEKTAVHTPPQGEVLSAAESVKRATMSVDDLEAPAAKPKSEPTLDDLRADLQQVITGKSPDAARAILKEFGAIKISEIKKEDYTNVMQACHKALKTK